MAAMKSMIMGVVDVGNSMSSPLAGNGRRKVEVATSFFSTYVLQRMIASKTVEFGLVAYGTDDTENYLNSTQGGYENVQEIVPMEKPDVNTVKYIAGVQCGKGSGDFIDGMVVGQDILQRTNVKKAYNRIMVVFTDGETKVEGVEDLETIVATMKAVPNFSLYIAMIGKVNSTSSVTKRENAKLFQSLAENVDGRYAEMEEPQDGAYLLAEGAGLGTKPQMLKTTFELSPQLKIPCVYWSKISKAKAPTLKKVATSALEAGDDDGEVGQVKRDTTYRNPEDPDVELAPEEKVKGYKYGPQYVPVTAVEEDMFKLKAPCSVTLVGSVPADRIPRHHFLEGPLFLQGAVDNDAAQVSIVALSRTLKETDRALLARFVKRENADPFLAALMPSDQEGQENCLLVHRIPCSEDIRDYLFPSLVAFEGASSGAVNATQKQQQSAVSAFVDALTLAEVPRTVLCPANPVLTNLYGTVRDKITGAITSEVNASTALKEGVVSPFLRAPGTKAALAALHGAFALEKVESSKKRRKTYWSELEVKSADVPGAVAASVVTPSGGASVSGFTEGETDAESMLSLTLDDAPAFTVGSVAPVEDFQSVLAFAADPALQVTADQRAAVVKGALQTLLDVVERHVTLGASPAYYKRALACLQAAREAAVKHGEYALFNAHLRDKVKLPHQFGRHSAFWRLVVDANLSLISSRDLSASSVTPVEADAFLHAKETEAVVAAAAPVTEEEDDLFGSMA